MPRLYAERAASSFLSGMILGGGCVLGILLHPVVIGGCASGIWLCCEKYNIFGESTLRGTSSQTESQSRSARARSSRRGAMSRTCRALFSTNLLVLSSRYRASYPRCHLLIDLSSLISDSLPPAAYSNGGIGLPTIFVEGLLRTKVGS